MALEIQRGRSKWWYGRITINGRKVSKNLGVEIRGIIPESLARSGDLAFERSRAKAQAALEQLQLDIRKRRSSEELVQTIHEIWTGRRVRSIPIEDIALRWKALPRKRPLNSRYVLQAESCIGRFVGFLQKNHPRTREMADVQSEMVMGFLRAEEVRGVSPKTYNNYLILLRSIFESLRKAGGLIENPFESIPTQVEDTVFRKPFSADELGAIVAAAKTEPFVEPIIITAISTAMRKGDCCTLLWTAVDLPGRFISVKTSKTGELVQIPIFPLLYDVLSKRKRDQSPYVFHEQALKYKVHPDYLTYGLQRVMRRAGFFDREDAAGADNHGPAQGEIHQPRPNGIRKASVRDFHSFRVTWVTLALSAGVPLEIVQKVTGHRTAGIVMKHYFQPGREEFRRTLVGKLPALIGGGPERKPLEAAEVRKLLAAMTHDNWQEIRDRLVAPQTDEAAHPIEVTSDETLSLSR